MKNPFDFVRYYFDTTDDGKNAQRRRRARVVSGTPTEFIFCNRKFGAVIVDTSETGMKLSCDIRLAIGSVITLVEPAISGKIVWRDDRKNLFGITFIKERNSISS